MSFLFFTLTVFAAVPQNYKITRCNADNECQSRIESRQIDLTSIKSMKHAHTNSYLQNFENKIIDVKELSFEDGRVLKINKQLGQVISDCRSGGDEEFFTECAELATE
jgi:hypothetical protein